MYVKISGIYGIMYKGQCIYVGQSISLNARKNDHKQSLKAGTHHSRYLQNIYNKHGYHVMEWFTLDTCPPEDLTSIEQYWVNMINPPANTLKICVDSCKGRKLTEEHKAAISKYGKGRKLDLSPEERKARSDRAKARVVSEETKQKLRDRVRTPKTRASIKAAQSEAVICIETGIIYTSANEASIALGRHRTAVGKAIAARGMCGGLHFRFVDRPEFEHKPIRNDKKVVICEHDGKIFPSQVACAKFYNISIGNLSIGIKNYTPVKGKYFRRFEC